MFNYKIICFSILLFTCKQGPKNCNSQELEKSEICPRKEYQFELSHSDESKIGYPEEDEFEIGPNSICIHDDKVYFINPLFSKVNGFDLNKGDLISSISLSELSFSKYSWKPTLIDIACFNNKIFALTRSDSIIIFSLDLNYLGAINVNCNGQKEFYKLNREEVAFYCYKDEKIIILNTENIIRHEETEEGFNITDLTQRYLGEKYEYDKDSLKFISPYGTIELKEEIQPITLSYYQCKNFGFNSEYFVHFSIDPGNNKITFYSYCY